MITAMEWIRLEAVPVNYEARIKLLRVETFLFLEWARSLAIGDSFNYIGQEQAILQIHNLREGFGDPFLRRIRPPLCGGAR